MSRNPHFSIGRFTRSHSLNTAIPVRSDYSNVPTQVGSDIAGLILVDCASCGNTICVEKGDSCVCEDCRKAAEIAAAFKPLGDAAGRMRSTAANAATVPTVFGKKRKGATMYASTNFKTKKAFKEAVASGEKITLYAPGLGEPKTNGKESVEGPHYPAAHTWYASVEVKDGIVVKVS